MRGGRRSRRSLRVDCLRQAVAKLRHNHFLSKVNVHLERGHRFIQLHPGNRDIAYAYYLKSLCYYEQISDIVRDQLATERALEQEDPIRAVEFSGQLIGEECRNPLVADLTLRSGLALAAGAVASPSRNPTVTIILQPSAMNEPILGA